MSDKLRSRRAATHAGTNKQSTNTRPDPQSAISTSSSTTTHTSHTTTMADPDDPRIPLLGAKKLVPAHPDAASSSSHVAPSTTPLSPELKDAAGGNTKSNGQAMENLSKKNQWIVLALASGACAAFNGVFAKLTTTELTTTFATAIANLVGLSNVEGGVEIVVRAIFFALNLIFNGIMWTLFTKALARGTSTTQVSILNTSSNFMITAVLGFFIFSEKLPGMWFVGAAMLVAGNVIIGRRDEGEKEEAEERGGSGERGLEEGEGLLDGEEVELDEDVRGGVKGVESSDEEDILDFEVVSEEESEITRSRA